MGKLLLLVALLVVVFLANRPDKMPTEYLNVYSAQPFNDGKKIVGGPCLGEKCLTVYVAPWCSTCHALNPMIISLVNQLESEGISVNVVVGKDSINEVESYAKKYPFDVLTDHDGRFYRKAKLKGVPYFAVTNVRGEIINDYFGGYTDADVMRDKLDI